VIITHRPALAAIADQIVMLKDGKTSTEMAEPAISDRI
jgi:ABC-type protease/lipase transport system fused ATPase/permease subunit